MIKQIAIFTMIVLLFWSCNSNSDHASNEHDIKTLISNRKALIKTTLQQDIPVIRLVNSKEGNLYKAQEIFLKDAKVTSLYKTYSKQNTLSEIFSVSPIRPSDLSSSSPSICKSGECYRVELYNYALNLAVIGIVNTKTSKIVNANVYPGIQPDVPLELVKLATAIAVNDSKVKKAYGEYLDPKSVLMPATKTALNKSKCERSLHLCVAPTFVKGEKALWAIVDLTDLKVVGVKWTNVGSKSLAVTEKRYQNENIMTCCCDTETSVEKGNWKFNYSITRSDGLRISQVFYKNKPVFNDVKLVDWHVSYSKTDGFGYSDAVGCPEYSQAAVLAVEPPFISPIIENQDTIGFALTQKYFSEGWPAPCNYNYQQNYEFYNDGRFRPVAASLGRGCGTDGTYRPVTRISIAGNDNSMHIWKDNKFEKIQKESWYLQKEITDYSPEKYWFELKNKDDNGFHISPNTGDFDDKGHGDNAYVFFTKRHLDKGEGEEDLPTIGPCCNLDYHQGPEKFIEPNPESIVNSEIVMWYVPQIDNDGRKGHEYCWAESVLENGVYVAQTYPCFSGPMFVPFANN